MKKDKTLILREDKYYLKLSSTTLEFKKPSWLGRHSNLELIGYDTNRLYLSISNYTTQSKEHIILGIYNMSDGNCISHTSSNSTPDLDLVSYSLTVPINETLDYYILNNDTNHLKMKILGYELKVGYTLTSNHNVLKVNMKTREVVPIHRSNKYAHVNHIELIIVNNELKSTGVMFKINK